MEGFLNPDESFLWGEYFDITPADAVTKIHPSERQGQVDFTAQVYPAWTPILGLHTNKVYSAVHCTMMVAASSVADLFHMGFLKAYHFQVHDEYIKYLIHKRGLMNSKESKLKSVVSVYYTAEKAYTWGSDISIDGIKGCSHRNLVVGVDMTTRKPAPLDEEWRQKSLKFIKDSNRDNKSLDFPRLAHGYGTVLHTISVEIQEGHLDYFRHANYKVYIFGGITCIRDALIKNKLIRYLGLSIDDVIVRDSVTVFERECVLGQTVNFDLVQTEEGDMYVVSRRDNTRLAYTKYELEVIPNNTSQL